jgi:hypothetical protein
MWNSATLDSDNTGREFESYRFVKLDLIWLTSIEMSDQSTRDPSVTRKQRRIKSIQIILIQIILTTEIS